MSTADGDTTRAGITVCCVATHRYPSDVRRLLLLLVVGLVLIGCRGSTSVDASDGDATGATSTVTSEPALADGTSAGQAAPFGTVTLVDGASLDGAEYAGDDLALWFWAPW